MPSLLCHAFFLCLLMWAVYLIHDLLLATVAHACVDAEFHAKGLLAPGSGGLKESTNTLQLGPSLSFSSL